MLDINGFEVKDIGVDVPVQNLRRRNRSLPAGRGRAVRLPHAGLRCDEGNHRGLRASRACATRVKIMIGGGQIDETVRNIPAPTLSASMRWKRSPCAATGWGWRHERPGLRAKLSAAKQASATIALAAHARLRRTASSPIACRWPCTPTFWLAKYGGISYQELMYDYERQPRKSANAPCWNSIPTSGVHW